jgi:hypothetical protein
LVFVKLFQDKTDIRPGDKNTGESTESTFEYVTGIEPDRENAITLTAGGRLRWKIENEGFNTQKCGVLMFVISLGFMLFRQV